MSFGCAMQQVLSEAKACVCKWAHEGERPRENMRKKQPGMMKCLRLGTLITPQIPLQNHSAVVILPPDSIRREQAKWVSTHTHRVQITSRLISPWKTSAFRVTHCYVHCAFHKRPFQTVYSRRNHSYKRSHTYKLLRTYKLCHEAYCFMADHRFL